MASFWHTNETRSGLVVSARHHKPPVQSWVYALGIAAILLVGCKEAAVRLSPSAAGYTGALDTSYEGALDATDQLALGTLNLEGTESAVAEEQAAKLLPLWQTLQGSELRGDAERSAVVQQIEGTMTEAQVAAIVGMRLTEEDAQAWAQSRGSRAGPGGGRAQGGQQGQGGQRDVSPEERATRRAQFQNISPEELATRRAQFGGQGAQGGAGRAGVSAGGDASMDLTRAVIALLVERSGQAVTRNVRLTATPLPTETPLPRRTRPGPTASPTPEPTSVPTQTVEPTSAPESMPTATPMPAPTVTATTSADKTISTGTPTPVATPVPALQQVEDTNPGPPFSIEISANIAAQDPLVERSRRYKITGVVRNDGDQTYAVSALHVTFFDAEGFRGSFYRFPGRGRTGGEWIWHGQTEADFPCLLLAPGEECPFSVEITAQDMASFMIHADAVPTERLSLPVQLGGVVLVDEGVDYVRVTGTATNGSSLKVKHVTVSGVLLDASGQIASVGATYVIEEDIEPGASVPFDLRIKRVPFVGYRLYAQAERDWE